MQKPYLFAVAILCLSTSLSCKKKEMGPFDFKVVGLADLPLHPGDYYYNRASTVAAAYQKIQVQYVGGAWESISVSLTGVPTGIKTDIDVLDSGPNWTANINYSPIGLTDLGTYPVKLHVVTKSGIVKDFPFNIVVSDCNNVYTGIYTATDYDKYGNPANKYKIEIKQGAVTGTVILSNIFNNGTQLQASSACKGIILSAQTVNNINYYSGYGEIGVSTEDSVLWVDLSLAYKGANNDSSYYSVSLRRN